MQAFKRYFLPFTITAGGVYEGIKGFDEVSAEFERGDYQMVDSKRARNIMSARIAIGILAGCVLGPIVVITAPLTVPTYLYHHFKKD